jgi:hypothetical protein
MSSPTKGGTVNDRTHEFTAEENAAFARLAARMRVVGRLLVVAATLAAAESLVLLSRGSGSALGLEIGVILLLIGLWSVRASMEFSRVTQTQGADISHLMKAVRELKKLYDVQFWGFIALAVMLALTLLAVVVGPGRLTGPYP